jgi:hypothetical protein
VDDTPTQYTFVADVWEHDGAAAWYFVSLPEDDADDIENRFGHRAAGFGSVRVEVTIGTMANLVVSRHQARDVRAPAEEGRPRR